MSTPTVRVIIGANAYAVIKTAGQSLNVLLSPGRSAPQSLRESAAEMRSRAHEMTERAALMETAAEVLEVAP